MKFPWGRRAQRERELEDELRSHLAISIRARIEAGEPSEQARANALREFGNVGLIKETTREMWGWASLFAFWGTRLMRQLLFEVSATDLTMFGLTAAVLIAIAGAVCWIPARRASRVDPMITLRAD